ncbi:MAG: hypothetical protein A2W31_04755, partial [Planctomycetes bacterium RBG_16_64_10]
ARWYWPDAATQAHETLADARDAGQAPLGYHLAGESAWSLQYQPRGLVYRAYLAGEKESRFRGYWAHEKNTGWMWDITLGGHVGLLRYGTAGPNRPEGFQIDLEGAAMPRLDLEQDADLTAADFRFGIPVTYGTAAHQVKLAFYHLSSHLGDEFLLRNPGFLRLNYSRDALVYGHSWYPADELRLYAEIGYAFGPDVADPLELQFGVEHSPACATGPRGAPFAAVAGHLREEVHFGGNLVVQVGWAWRGDPASGLLRTGFEYYYGKSDQFSLFDQHEDKAGLAIWYDY